MANRKENEKAKKGFVQKTKKQIKEFFSYGDIEIPEIAHRKSRSFMVIGIIAILASVFFGIISSSFSASFFGMIFGVAVLIHSYMEKVFLSKKGFYTIEGECANVEYTILPNARGDKTPSRFLIRDDSDGKMIALSYTKQNISLDIGDRVCIYIKNGGTSFVRKGAYYYSDIIGYELL